ncbi:MAG TPA: VTT domain-containing protein [Polyangiaceae bacterium]|nr:VTT domain-containing protein [Polyangiaceae bacterium]
MPATEPSEPPPPTSYWHLLGVVLLAAVLLSVPFAIVGELPGERWLSAADDRAPLFAALGVLLLAADVLLPIPSSVVGVMLGARLGLLAGFACCLLGLILGHGIGYGLGRLAPERWAPRAPRAPSLLGIFLSRPVPMLAEALAVAAGATRMPLGHFLAAAALGDAIYAAVLAAAGARLLSTGAYLMALVVPMGLIAVAGWAASRAQATRR